MMSLRSGGFLDGGLFFVCEVGGWGGAGAWRGMGVGGYNNTQNSLKLTWRLSLTLSVLHGSPTSTFSSCSSCSSPNHQQQLPLPSLLSNPPILFPISVANLTVTPLPLSLSSFWLGWVGLPEME